MKKQVWCLTRCFTALATCTLYTPASFHEQPHLTTNLLRGYAATCCRRTTPYGLVADDTDVPSASLWAQHTNRLNQTIAADLLASNRHILQVAILQGSLSIACTVVNNLPLNRASFIAPFRGVPVCRLQSPSWQLLAQREDIVHATMHSYELITYQSIEY